MAEEADPNPSLIKEEEVKTIVVILVGAPGSGKSTFCTDVMNLARRPWARICQDTIANGKAGTKLQCLKSAADALKEGKNVLIDRCNLDRDQRFEFVKLGAEADVHAVVLDLPAQLCISRSVKRTGHEGNLQGGKAAAVVNRMLQNKELPKLNEGFSRITFCQSESDVKNAVGIYRSLGPSDILPSGTFGRKGDIAKVQQGIMKFLTKVASGADSSQIHKGTEVEKDKQGNEILRKPAVGSIQWNDAPTLAFPSVSTSDFQFNQDKASDIIVETVAEFLSKFDNIRLVLVDLNPKSSILALVMAKALKNNIDASRFLIHAGDITRLYSEGGLHCNAIANAANWRLKPGGGGVNAAIFSAGGQALEAATKEEAETISPGSSIVVRVPTTSPLYQREGVTHVIHVLGPNMNPQRPNYLKGDYVKGCKVLHDAYSSLFRNFTSITRNLNYQKECGEDSKPGSSNLSRKGNMDNRSLHGEQKIKREGIHASDTKKKSKCNGELVEEEEPENDITTPPVIRTWGSWAQAIHRIAMHPDKHKEVLEMSVDYVVINDLYPKAKKHLLVVSRLLDLDCLADVRREHQSILKKMHDVGLKWADQFLHQDASLLFRLGYHSVPSMRQLHLHVISQDFNSAHLKNKKHWNSFNTIFFRDSVDIIEEIEMKGLATINDDEKLLSSELRCHHCRSAHPNIPRLKSHIANCKVPFPSHLQNGRLLFAGSSEAVGEC